MTIRFTCPDCDKRLKVDDRFAGRQVDCPRCGRVLLIPATPLGVASSAGEPSDSARDDRSAGAKRASPPPASRRPSLISSRHGTVEGSDLDPPMHLKRSPAPDEELDLTPMVDVTFQLLIFFMLTAAFALQKAIDLPTPDPTQAVATSRTLEEIEEDDDYVIVRIEDDNTILLEDRQISRQEVVPRLRELRERPAGKNGRPPNSLMVMASGEALHETVVLVLDAGSEAGMENVRLATADDEG